MGRRARFGFTVSSTPPAHSQWTKKYDSLYWWTFLLSSDPALLGKPVQPAGEQLRASFR